MAPKETAKPASEDTTPAATQGDNLAAVDIRNPGDNTAPAQPASEGKAAVYRVVAPGLVWSKDGRPRQAKQGSKRSDIPPESVPWLLAAGHIELVSGGEGGEADPAEMEE